MRLHVLNLQLSGTSRSVELKPGLNVIVGPISTGKTSILRLIRMALGSGGFELPPEIRKIEGISVELLLGESAFQVFRPMSLDRKAMVEIAGVNLTERVPVLQPDDLSNATYGQWLLAHLGLPRLEVPQAPTQPDSEPTPVSINDYLAYCDLAKEEIRSQVFGHRHPFKDIKRKYVFQIIYGQYDIRTVQLQDEIRDVRGRLRAHENDVGAFERLVADTAWENRAQLETELRHAEVELAEVMRSSAETAKATMRNPEAEVLRRDIDRQDIAVARIAQEIGRESADVSRFQRLSGQIETQMGRLTRAIVAKERLGGIEFVICPRCGSDVDQDRAHAETCYLCLQPSTAKHTKRELAAEQERLASELLETRQLVESRRSRLTTLERDLEKARTEREGTGRRLDQVLASFVSDSASRLQDLSSRRAVLTERTKRLRDYLQLYHRREMLRTNIDVLRAKEVALIAQLDEAKARRADVEARIEYLEDQFTGYLQRLSLPDFLGEPVGRIDRTTYMPSVSGRSFDALQSEGLAIEVNVAHALAHQRTAYDLGIPLPSILLIDGVSGAFGTEGYDPKRVEGIYRQLIETAEVTKGAIQIIVADTRIPKIAEPFVTLRLSESDRLIPAADLARLAASAEEP